MSRESWPTFALRLAMLLGFACGLAAMAPQLWFMLTHPGLTWPAGQDYHAAVVSGAHYYRVRGADGRLVGYVEFSGRVRESGKAVEWSGRGSASGGE